MTPGSGERYVLGILIADGWSLRQAAKRIFPYSFANRRRWFRAWLHASGRPATELGSARQDWWPAKTVRQSRIPHRTKFINRRAA